MKARFPAVRTVRLPLLALALSAPALAQDPAPSPTEDVHERMRKLIVQIEKGLGHVDRLLWSAVRPDEDGESLGKTIKSDEVLKDTILIMLTSWGQRGDAAHLPAH